MPGNRSELGTFLPGASGNPSGRPKVLKEFHAWLDEECFPKAKIALLQCLCSDNEKVKIAAVKEVLDRLFGKAPQTITGPDGGPVRFDGDIRGRILTLLAGKSE